MVVHIRATSVMLASTPDGLGELCTDDEMHLTLQARGRETQQWRYLFADAEQQGIACLPPQRLVLQAGPGRYTVRLVLYDRFPFTYSSRPYYLVGATAVGHNLMTASTTTLSATATTLQATATSTPEPAPIAVAPAVPLVPVATTAPQEPTIAVPAETTVTVPEVRSLPWPLLALLLMQILLAISLFFLLIVRRRSYTRQPARLSGILDVTDCTSGESRTVLLHGFPCGAAIVREPLQVIALNPDAPPLSCFAMLEAGDTGPQLRVDRPEAADMIILRSNEPVRVNEQLELRYRN
jgi:hypothetical protein